MGLEGTELPCENREASRSHGVTTAREDECVGRQERTGRVHTGTGNTQLPTKCPGWRNSITKHAMHQSAFADKNQTAENGEKSPPSRIEYRQA